MARPYQVEEVTTEAGFEALRGEWSELLDRCGSANPFVTFEWQWSWWRTLGQGRRLLILTARDDARKLRGVAPLMVSRRWGARVVEFIGTGLSDYLEFVGERGDADLFRLFIGHLSATARRWDVINLFVTNGHSARIGHAREAARERGLHVYHRPYTEAPFLPIRGRWDEFLRSRSKTFAYTLQRKKRKFLAQPGAHVRRLEASAVSPALVEQLWAVERKSWKLAAGTAQLETPAARAFYVEYLREFSERKWVEVWLATVGDTPIAYSVNFVHQNRVLFYNGAFDADYAALSPGSVLFQFSVEDAFHRHADEYDFLAGDEPYKRTWTAESRPIAQVVMAQRRPYSRLVALLRYRLRWKLARSERLKQLHARLIGAAAFLRRPREGA